MLGGSLVPFCGKHKERKNQIGLVFIFLLLLILPSTLLSLFASFSHTLSASLFRAHEIARLLIYLFSVLLFFCGCTVISVDCHFSVRYLCIQNTANYNMWGQNAERIFIKCLSNQPTENGSGGGCLIGWCWVYFFFSLSLFLHLYSFSSTFLRSIVIARRSQNDATLLGANFQKQKKTHTHIHIVAITMRCMQETAYTIYIYALGSLFCFPLILYLFQRIIKKTVAPFLELRCFWIIQFPLGAMLHGIAGLCSCIWVDLR